MLNKYSPAVITYLHTIRHTDTNSSYLTLNTEIINPFTVGFDRRAYHGPKITNLYVATTYVSKYS